MKISTDYPPNYRDILEALGEQEGAVFCYGDTIYNPFHVNILPDIEVHETVHMRQQGENVPVWYHRYLTEPAFRLEQELEAYGKQYAFVKKHVPGPLRKWRLNQMCLALSGREYGYLLSYHQAEKLIKQYGATA